MSSPDILLTELNKSQLHSMQCMPEYAPSGHERVSCHVQRLERRELELAEELRFIKERYVSLEANMAQILERLQMQDAESEARKLKRSNSFYGVFGLSK